MQVVYPLKGVLKNYDWGGTKFLPELLSLPADKNLACAEYWMGIHPQGVSTIQHIDGKSQFLNEVAELPFLFKVLDVKSMLSIQVHPSKTAAAIEFDLENKAGVPLDAPYRNYKDANHKPELMVALSEFWLLHGFKPMPLLIQTLNEIPELSFLVSVCEKEGYKGLYEKVMQMPATEIDKHLAPLLARITPLYEKGQLDKSDANFWAVRATKDFPVASHIDRGIFSIYFFNLVRVEPGQAVFQDAGVPHAYLEGQNVEIMANSDNVLRGGLTNKHVDVKELLKHVKFFGIEPIIINPSFKNGSITWITPPVDDFQLGLLQLKTGETIEFNQGENGILLCCEGSIMINHNPTFKAEKGSPSYFLAKEAQISLKAEANSILFIAQKGIHSR